jgi:hypothetical protein
VLKINHLYNTELVSDSMGFYLLIPVIGILSIIGCLTWSFIDRKRKNYDFLFYWFTVIISYYLTLELFTYGFNKVFKWQFYLPEPNILYTTIGNSTRDMLYWSTNGISRPYTIFSGLLEVFAGTFLLFKRTRLVGSLLAFSVLLNAVMINFCFDISVKVYSCFLLFLCLLIIIPSWKKLFQFFVSNKSSDEQTWIPIYTSQRNHIIYIICKLLVLGLILVDSLADYIKMGNYNDDKAPRPLFHGAYEVKLFIRNGDTLTPCLTDTFRWKRMFIHRWGYLITQSMNDEMQDYELEYDILDRKLIINKEGSSEKTNLNYIMKNDSIFILNGKMNNDSVYISFKKLDLNKMPLFKEDFSWTIDH